MPGPWHNEIATIHRIAPLRHRSGSTVRNIWSGTAILQPPEGAGPAFKQMIDIYAEDQKAIAAAGYTIDWENPTDQDVSIDVRLWQNIARANTIKIAEVM